MPTTYDTKLINQGSYGCIYYPSLPFTQKKNKNNTDDIAARKSYVSKIQKHNFHSEFEDYIGKKIQDIPSFEIFFVPVLSTYKIDLATIKQTYVTECDALSKYIKRNARDFPKHGERITTDDYQTLNKKFIMQKMRYINGKYLHRHLLQVVAKNTKEDSRVYEYRQHDTDSDRGSDSDNDIDNDSDNDSESGSDSEDERSQVSKTLRKDEHQVKKYRTQFKQDETEGSYSLMSIAFDLYERIMDSIQLLIKYKIVHYDLKENNILVEKIQQLPYIIDFGLSIDIDRLLKHPWSDKEEEKSKSSETSRSRTKTKTTIDSNVLYSSDSSKIFKNNYLWKEHFYVHAPDYFLWPIEVHLITYLINEHDTLTEESLRKICFEYITNNRAIEYMSRDFKRKMFDMSMETFSRFIHQPREKVLNELVKFWDKWDMYAINIMFLKIMYELIFHREIVLDDATSTPTPTPSEQSRSSSKSDAQAEENTVMDDASSQSLNEERQKKLDPYYSFDAKMEFKSRYKIKLKQKYNNYKIMNTIQVMLRNIHPNPDKRMTPQETKTFFVSIFYEC
jgi:hypothetical protein